MQGDLSAVVDTNLVVSGLILERGQPFEVVEALRQSAFTLVLSQPLYDEYAEVLRRPKFARYGLTPEIVARFLSLIAATAPRTELVHRLPLEVRDADDEMVLGTALGGAADFVVSGDPHLLELGGRRKLGSLRIITARRFIDILDERARSTQD